MTDLPELMRQHADYMATVTDSVGSPDAIERALLKGADEIERLVEIVGRIRGYYNDLQAHHEKHCLPSCGMAYGVLLDPAEFSVSDAPESGES